MCKKVGYLVRAPEQVNKQLISEDVQLLLLISSAVCVTRDTVQLGNT